MAIPLRHSCESRNPDAVIAKAGNYKIGWIPLFMENPEFRIKCGMTRIR